MNHSGVYFWLVCLSSPISPEIHLFLKERWKICLLNKKLFFVTGERPIHEQRNKTM